MNARYFAMMHACFWINAPQEVLGKMEKEQTKNQTNKKSTFLFAGAINTVKQNRISKLASTKRSQCVKVTARSSSRPSATLSPPSRNSWPRSLTLPSYFSCGTRALSSTPRGELSDFPRWSPWRRSQERRANGWWRTSTLPESCTAKPRADSGSSGTKTSPWILWRSPRPSTDSCTSSGPPESKKRLSGKLGAMIRRERVKTEGRDRAERTGCHVTIRTKRLTAGESRSSGRILSALRTRVVTSCNFWAIWGLSGLRIWGILRYPTGACFLWRDCLVCLLPICRSTGTTWMSAVVFFVCLDSSLSLSLIELFDLFMIWFITLSYYSPLLGSHCLFVFHCSYICV